jgi:hypothetical protein
MPYYIMTVIIAVFLLTASAGGILMTDIYFPFVSAELLPGTYSQDLVSLFAVPLLIVSMLLASRGSVRGMAMWPGFLGYVLYAYALYSFDRVYSVFFPLYVALFGLSLYTLIGLLTNIDAERFCQYVNRRMPARVISMFLMTPILLVLPWSGFVLKGIAAQTAPETNTILVLDLSFLIPALLIVAIRIWKRQTWGFILAGVLLVKAATLGLSLIIGAYLQYREGTSFNWWMSGFFIYLTVAATILSIIYLRNLQGQVEETI